MRTILYRYQNLGLLSPDRPISYRDNILVFYLHYVIVTNRESLKKVSLFLICEEACEGEEVPY